MDYFKLFNLPRKFNIDINLLCKNFYKLQLRFHPDLFVNDSDFDKKKALKKSTKINEGYNILKHSLSRVTHLLFLYGFDFNSETMLINDKEFLMQQFSLHEELNFIKNNDLNKIQLNVFLKKIEKKIKFYENLIEVECNKKNWKKVIEITSKLFFFEKIKRNLT